MSEQSFNDMDEIADLISKQLMNIANDDEKKALQKWIQAKPEHKRIYDRIVNRFEAEQDTAPATENEYLPEFDLWEAMLLQQQSRHTLIPFYRKKYFKSIAFGCTIALAILLGYFTLRWTGIYPSTTDSEMAWFTEEEQFPQMGALLLHYDGNITRLDPSQDTVIIQHGNISYTNGKKIFTYEPADYDSLLTLSTPKQVVLNVILSDSSFIQLSPASSLQFPIAFTGEKRHVTFTGEAFFDINKIKKSNHPATFTITTVQDERLPATIQVLGTSFWVSALQGLAQMETTVLTGTVRMEKGKYSSIIQKGQRAIYHESGITVKEVDTYQYEVRNLGFLSWDNTSMEQIIHSFANWYNLQIVHPRIYPNRRFTMKIDKDKNVFEAAQSLQNVGINVMIDTAFRPYKLIILN